MVSSRKVHTPGALPELPPLPPLPDAEPARADDSDAARMAKLEQDNTQMRVMLQALVERGQLLPPTADSAVKSAKLIGDDVRPMSSTQFLANIAAGNIAKPINPVLCSDGYLCFSADRASA